LDNKDGMYLVEAQQYFFNVKILNTSEVVDLINRLSWPWFICRVGSSSRKNCYLKLMD